MTANDFVEIHGTQVQTTTSSSDHAPNVETNCLTGRVENIWDHEELRTQILEEASGQNVSNPESLGE